MLFHLGPVQQPCPHVSSSFMLFPGVVLLPFALVCPFLIPYQPYHSLPVFCPIPLRFCKDTCVRSLKILFFRYIILLGVQICILRGTLEDLLPEVEMSHFSVCQEWQKSISYNNRLLLIDFTQLKMCVSEA